MSNSRWWKYDFAHCVVLPQPKHMVWIWRKKKKTRIQRTTQWLDLDRNTEVAVGNGVYCFLFLFSGKWCSKFFLISFSASIGQNRCDSRADELNSEHSPNWNLYSTKAKQHKSMIWLSRSRACMHFNCGSMHSSVCTVCSQRKNTK